MDPLALGHSYEISFFINGSFTPLCCPAFLIILLSLPKADLVLFCLSVYRCHPIRIRESYVRDILLELNTACFTDHENLGGSFLIKGEHHSKTLFLKFPDRKCALPVCQKVKFFIELERFSLPPAQSF